MHNSIIKFESKIYFINQVHFQKLVSKTISTAINELINYHTNWETDKIQRITLTLQDHKELFIT